MDHSATVLVSSVTSVESHIRVACILYLLWYTHVDISHLSLVACHITAVNDIEKDNFSKQQKKICPEISDYLTDWSTIPGHMSMHGKISGSWFISVLVEVFYANAHKMSITDMMTTVNGKMATKCSRKNMQQSETHNALQKLLYFYPGEYNNEKDKRTI